MCKRLVYVVFAAVVLTLASTSHAVVIGNWEKDLDGWVVGAGGADARFDEVNGVTLGKNSLGIHMASNSYGSGWNPDVLVLDLMANGLVDAFKANQKITVDVTWKMADWPVSPVPGWNGIHMIVNAGGTNWSAYKLTPEQANWTRAVGRDQTIKATFDYSQWFAEMKNLQDVGWLELRLVSNCNDSKYSGPVTFYLDNMQLLGAGKALSPQPLNNGKDVSNNPRLSWDPGYYAASHNVYFGTNTDAVANAKLASDPNVVFVKTSTAVFDPGVLQFNSRYYWRVDEVNDAKSGSPWVGSVWNFTTGDFITVDDFEKYDDVCNRIFFAWVDGYGYSASQDCHLDLSNGNGTGSTVGNLYPPFAEQTIVHSGRQSMPMDYTNNSIRTYSEAVRTWDQPQDWTAISRYDALKLYVRGIDGNGADRLYVRIQDSAGSSATAANPDTTVVTDVNWTEWVIPLSDLKDVNLASVKKMTIGVGNPSSPAQASGEIFIDDIRVGPKPYGLVTYFAMENNANDSSGNGFNGTLAGDPNLPVTYVAGPTGMGKAMMFMGTQGSQYIDLGTFNPSAATGRLSVALWAKWNGLNDGWQGLIGKRVTWGVDTMMWQIEADRAAGVLQFQSGDTYVADADGALPVGQWTHVAVTFDGTTAVMYINGVQNATGTFGFGYLYTAPLAIGASGAGPVNPFNGALDEVRVYDKALSAAEVVQVMKGK